MKASGLKWGRGSQIKNHCKKAGGAGARAAVLPAVPRFREVSARGRALPRMGCSPPSPQCIPRRVSPRDSTEVSISETARSPGQTPRGWCHVSALPPRQFWSASVPNCRFISGHEWNYNYTAQCRQELPHAGSWQRATQPKPFLPSPSCLPAAGGGGSTGDPRGRLEGEQNRPKKLLKAAGKSSTIYNGKGRHSWREGSRRGFLQTSTTQDQ